MPLARYKKVTLRIPAAQADDLDRILRWGERDAVFRRFASALVDAHETHGSALVGSILTGARTIRFERPDHARDN